MQRLGPILLADETPPWVTRSCDISILHKQIHGPREMTGSGQASMTAQTRLAASEQGCVGQGAETAFLCDLRGAPLCFINGMVNTWTYLNTHVNINAH